MNDQIPAKWRYIPSELTQAENLPDAVHSIRWHLPTINTTRKSAAEIAQALRPLLQVARTVCIVDPYFDPGAKRFQDVFSAIVAQALEAPRAVQARPSITLVTSIEREFKGYEERTEKGDAGVAAHILNLARRHLSPLLPPEMTVELIIVKNVAGGDPAHNRFVITDVGGVIVPYGVDDYDCEEEHSAKDDLTPMLRGIFNERRNQFVERRGLALVQRPERISAAK